jgi:hypothetical protein
VTEELRVVDEVLLVSDASPDELFASIGRPLGFTPYDGAELLEVRELDPSPEGHRLASVVWADGLQRRTEIVYETFVERPPHHVAVRATDAHGQVIRFDYVLTARGCDTELRLRAALEQESRASRSRYEGRWINDRLMARGVAAHLGRVRHEFHKARAEV